MNTPSRPKASKGNVPSLKMLLTRASLFSCRGGLIVGMLANLRAALASTSLLPDRQEYAKGDFSHRVNVVAQEQRNLQSTCSAEKAFTITSSVLPLTEGCYLHSKTEEDKDIYIADTAFAYSQVVPEKSNNEYWALAENEDGFTSNSEGSIVCLSQEVFEDVAHPVDATWECDIDGDSMADNLTTTQFSISCGCPETPAPTAAPIRVLPVNGTCGDPLDEILVKSTFDPDLEGCYKETPSTSMDLPTYTVSGTNASEQIYMQAQQQDDSTLVNWILAYIPMGDDPDDFVVYCYSGEEAEDVHPSEVETWYCDTDDDKNTNPVEVLWTNFDVLCGCTPSSSPLDSPAPYLPSTSYSPASTSYPPASTSYPPASTPYSFKCGGAEDQFQITSTEVSEIYGECFTAANASSSNDTIIYTPDGTRNVGQFFVTPGEDERGNFRWVIGFASSEGKIYQYYYVSREEAATVHPTEATWDILPDADVTGSGPTELVVECGCQNLEKITQEKNATTSKLPIALPAIIWGIMIVIVSMIFVSISEP